MWKRFSWKMNLRISSLLVTRTVGSGQDWWRVVGSSRDVQCSRELWSWAGVLRRGGGLAERSELHGSVAELGFRTSASPQVSDESAPRSLNFRNTCSREYCVHLQRNINKLCLSGPRWWRLSTRQSTARPEGSSSAFCQGPSVRITPSLTHTQVQDPKRPCATSHVRVRSCRKKHFIFTRKCAAWPWVQRTARPTGGRRLSR